MDIATLGHHPPLGLQHLSELVRLSSLPHSPVWWMLQSSSSLVGNLVGGGAAETCSELEAEFGDRKSEIQAALVRVLGYNGRRKGRGEQMDGLA